MTSRPWSALTGGHIPRIDCDHTPRAGLCPSCTRTLAGVLDDTPALLRELDIAIIRDVNFPEHGSTATTTTDPEESALPYDDRALDAKHQLVAALQAAGDLTHQAGRPKELARRIRAHLGRLAHHPSAPAVAARIARAADHAHQAIDRPPSPWYYGPCPGCGRDLYLDRVDAAGSITCPRDDCAYTATVAEHHTAQLDAGDDRMLTVGELVGAITAAGEVVTRDQINGWIRREGLPREQGTRLRWVDGRIVVTDVYVYRLGDVRRLALEAEIRRRPESHA